MPFDQPGIDENLGSAVRAFILDSLDQPLDGEGGQLFFLDMNGGNFWGDDLRFIDIVEAGNGNIVGDPDSKLRQGLDHTDGHVVAFAE